MSHMSAANTPAQGPFPTSAPPPLDLDAGLRKSKKPHPLSSGSGSSGSDTTAEVDEQAHQDAILHPDWTHGWSKDHPLFTDLAPQDSYDVNGVYWVSRATKPHSRGKLTPGGPALRRAPEMGQRAEQRRDQARVEPRRGHVQEGPALAAERVLEAIRHGRFRSLHRGLRVSPIASEWKRA